jgi:hypothetical protein
MSWLRRLLGLSSKSPQVIFDETSQPRSWREHGVVPFACNTRDFCVEVVGESHYQNALKAARQSRGKDFVHVFLQREPNNPYDPNAVAVLSELLQVIGHLPRASAIAYAPVLDAVEQAGFRATCEGRIGGGSKDKPSLGIWLDLAEPDAIKQKLISRRSMA